MRIPAVVTLLLFGVTVAAGADPALTPELRGLMDLGNGKRFLLAAADGSGSSWEKIGDSFGTWTVAEYRDQDQALVLQGADGAKISLHLASSPVPAAEAGDEVYALNYLQTRVLQLRQDYEAAKKDLEAFEKKHDGRDHAHWRDGPEAIAGNELFNRAAYAKQRYEAVFQRLKDAENAGAPPSGGN